MIKHCGGGAASFRAACRRSARPPLSNAAAAPLTLRTPLPLPAESKALTAKGEDQVIEASGQQIIVRNDGTLVIVPGNGQHSSLSGPAPRATAESEYLTGGCCGPDQPA